MKTAMLPLGLGFLGLLFFMPPKRMNRQKLLFSVTVFLLLSAPLVAILSGRVGRLSFGETGQLNYAWYVNRLQDAGWTGSSPEAYGTPEHPPRKLTQTPLTLEFDSPVSGTYPLWYDPSYWYAGAKMRFDLRQQIIAVKDTLRTYEVFVFRTAAYVAGLVVLFVWCLHEKILPTVPRTFWWQVAWPVAACSMYALVHVESRFLSPFLVLFWLTIYSVLILRLKKRSIAPILATVVCAVMLTLTADLVAAGARTMRDFVRPRQPEDYETVAVGLRNLGLHSGAAWRSSVLPSCRVTLTRTMPVSTDCVWSHRFLTQTSFGVWARQSWNHLKKG